jgi:GNAT superfamily N-acetyltransferase
MSEIHLRLSDPGRPRTGDLPLPGFNAIQHFLRALTQTVAYWWQRLQDLWRYSAALQELQALDPRTLKDIGLNRGDLHAVAYATARRGSLGRFGAVRIRRVDITDLPRCLEFGRLLRSEDVRLRFGRPAALGDADTFRRLFGLDDGKIETIGAFDLSGRILGLATVAWVGRATAEVALVVRSDLQRRGLGATLLAHIIKNARGAGYNLLVANIDHGNVPIRRLTQRFGFELAVTSATSTQAQLAIGT